MRYVICKKEYDILLNGFKMAGRDGAIINQKKGLETKENVIKYLNKTRGILNGITELVIKD